MESTPSYAVNMGERQIKLSPMFLVMLLKQYINEDVFFEGE